MIDSLHVENFRSFKQLELHRLKRINIIVGDNSSGKTVLLESIKMGLGAGPNVVPFLVSMRGMPIFFAQNHTAEQFQSYFIDLFHGFSADKRITISTVDSAQRSAVVQIYFDPGQAVTGQQPSLGFQPPSAQPPASTIIPLAFERTDFDGTHSTYYATTNLGNVLLQPAPELGITSGFFGGGSFGVPQENAFWLSKLSVEKRSAEVIASIRRHCPFIQDVTSETVLPGLGSVYVDVPHLPWKVPISLISAGISRLFTIMLAILTFHQGVVLVDEIENGMFYGQYRLVWDSLAELAAHHDTQLFISTHSKECLTAALSTVQKYPDAFSLLRARREDSESKIEFFSGAQLEGALEKNGEVRD